VAVEAPGSSLDNRFFSVMTILVLVTVLLRFVSGILLRRVVRAPGVIEYVHLNRFV
jgi:hypothetical protein